MLKKSSFISIAILAFLSIVPAWAQEDTEAPDSFASAEIGMGYVRNNGGSLGDGQNGFAFTLAGSANFRVADNFYPGFRVELVGLDSFGTIQSTPGTDLYVFSVTAAFEAAFGSPTDGIVPYIFAGGGIENWTLDFLGATLAETNGGVVEVGAGVRFGRVPFVVEIPWRSLRGPGLSLRFQAA